jgi:hypothetical protein
MRSFARLIAIGSVSLTVVASLQFEPTRIQMAVDAPEVNQIGSLQFAATGTIEARR